MNQITVITTVIGLCAITQLGFSQSSNVPSVGYSAPANGYTSSNYDFAPGDTLIFTDDYADDKTGKTLSRSLAGGKSKFNSRTGVKVFAFTNANRRGSKKGSAFLNDAFTLEFDNFSKGSGMPYVYFYKTAAEANAASNNLNLMRIGSPLGNEGTEEIEYKNHAANATLTANFPDDIKGEKYFNKWHHITLAYKKGEVTVYVDQYKVMVVPNIGFAPRAVGIEDVTSRAKKTVMIANFRIANGSSEDMTGKKFSAVKIITHGINFNVNKATIKPESLGTLNMIAGIMRGNATLRFEIDGHADNTGIPANNLALSEERAAEVRNQLINLGIDGSRLTTKGFGDTKPLSGNHSDEGKGNNRRVEFVRLK